MLTAVADCGTVANDLTAVITCFDAELALQKGSNNPIGNQYSNRQMQPIAVRQPSKVSFTNRMGGSGMSIEQTICLRISSVALRGSVAVGITFAA